MALVTCIRSIQQPLRQIRINLSALFKKGQKKPFLFRSALHAAIAQPFILQKNTSVSDIFVSKSEPKSVVSRIKVVISDCLFIFHVILRCIRYLVIFTPVIAFYLVTAASGKWFEAWSKSLLLAIELAGPVATKLGQWASTRRDLFPADICDILCQLQRRTKPHRWSKTQLIIEEMFHKPISEIFVKIDRVPIGSGCVAQVYKAKLTESAFANLKAGNSENMEESVAVKVLHPGIERQFRVDLFIMRLGTSFLDAIYWPLKWLDLPRCVDEFEKIMLSQVDLRVEAENTNVFNKNFLSNGNVTFAKPLYPFVAEKVLVETYEEGVSIELFYTEESKASMRKRLADIGANTLLKMIFEDNFVHGDLHPGNMLVRKDYYSNPSPLLIVLDCGITTKLTQKDLKDLSDTFKAIILKQGKVVADLFLERSFNKCPNPDLFKQEMEDLVMKLRGEKLTLRNTQVGALMNEVFSLMIRHKVRIESQFSSVVLAIAVLEGVGRSLDPDMDLITIARPYVIKEMTREIFNSDKNFIEHFMEDALLFSPFE